MLFCLKDHSSSAFKHATLLGLCSLVHYTLSELDCEAVWTRDEFLADCSLSCRRKIYSLIVVLRSRQHTDSFDLNVLLCQHILLFLRQLHHLLL